MNTKSNLSIDTLSTDVLMIGSGGAGLLAAIHAYDANRALSITVASKGLIGKSGCTRMVQGGYNVALSEGDSIEAHFRDTIEGGKWINDQELAWTLVSTAPQRVRELENRYGCFFDRNADGTVHQKAFAGQSFDRTVHKGDLTGIEIMNRLTEQIRLRPIQLLEEHRAIALIASADQSRIAAVLFIDIRSGAFRMIRAKAVVIATGAGPTMYKFHTPSADKSCDGLALALRFGIQLRDLEMVQFHPTGLLAGTNTRITGTIIEEGLRGAGGYLIDADGARFMFDYDERVERATRDIVSRAMFEQMRGGATGPNGGVFISMAHLNPSDVRKQFKGMVKRCADIGFDLVSEPVEVTPTAHYMMGGIEISTDCATSFPGVFAAGEDTGGVHGANRLGGNGVGNSTVFGGIAGQCAANSNFVKMALAAVDENAVHGAIELATAPLKRTAGNLNQIRESMCHEMWEHAGILRSESSLSHTEHVLWDLERQLDSLGVDGNVLHFNMSWHDWLNLQNQLLVSRAVTAAAKARTHSIGAHYRTDHPQAVPLTESTFTRVQLVENTVEFQAQPVQFTRITPAKDHN